MARQKGLAVCVCPHAGHGTSITLGPILTGSLSVTRTSLPPREAAQPKNPISCLAFLGVAPLGVTPLLLYVGTGSDEDRGFQG